MHVLIAVARELAAILVYLGAYRERPAVAVRINHPR